MSQTLHSSKPSLALSGAGFWLVMLPQLFFSPLYRALEGSLFVCSGGVKWDYLLKGSLSVPSVFRSLCLWANVYKFFQVAKQHGRLFHRFEDASVGILTQWKLGPVSSWHSWVLPPVFLLSCWKWEPIFINWGISVNNEKHPSCRVWQVPLLHASCYLVTVVGCGVLMKESSETNQAA